MSEFVLSAELSLKDNFTGKINKAKASLQGVKSVAKSTDTTLNGVEQAMNGVGSAADKLSSSVKTTVKQTEALQKVLKEIPKNTVAKVALKDEITSKLSGVQEKLRGISGKTYTAVVNVKQNVSGKVIDLKNSAMGTIKNTAMQMANSVGMDFSLYNMIQTYSDFTAQMSKVQSISGATGSELEALTAKAKEMGKTTTFSATQSAKALEYMAMAGWKTDDMLSGISGIMNLAAASGEDLGRVSDIVTDALTAFGLSAKDSGHFADVLAKAASSSNTNVSMMGETFKYVAPIAGALKYSIEDTATAIGLMANSGIKASEAGTSLRSIMTRLVTPPSDAAKALNAIGVSVKNADGTVKPFMNTMVELRKKFANLSDAEKTELANKIAGQEAMSGFLAIVNASDSDFDKLAGSIRNANGAAAEMAETANDNLQGDLKSLSSSWEAFQLSLMSSKGGFLRDLIQGIRDDVAKFEEYIKDGFNISDVGRIAIDIVKQLTNKFLELDGAGSVLAGGVLAGGLYKIIKLTKRAVGGIKNLGGSLTGGNSKNASGGLTSTMTVNANNVIVNGKESGSTPTGAPSDNGSKGKAKSPKAKGGLAGRIGNGGKLVGKAFAGIAAIMAGLDIYDKAKAYSADSSEENKTALGGSIGNGAGMLAGGVAGAKAGAVTGGAIGSLFGGIGAAPGAAIGGLVGGVGGSLLGGSFGEDLGKAIAGIDFSGIGEKITSVFSNAYDSVTTIWSEFSNWFDTTVCQPLSGSLTTVEDFLLGVGVSIYAVLTEALAPLGEWFNANVVTPIATLTTSLKDIIATKFTEAYNAVTSVWSGVSEWFSGVVWQPISTNVDVVKTTVVTAFSTAWQMVQSVWSTVAGWFESTVWTPLKSAVAGVSSAISSAFSSAVASVKGAWNGIASWFDSNVIQPIKSKFAQITSIGNNFRLTGAIPGHASGTSYAPGGWSEINEHGGEIVDLPNGSRVYPHATTMKMLSNMELPPMETPAIKVNMPPRGSTNTNHSINISGNTFTVREEADINRIAYQLLQLMSGAQANYNPI